MEPVEDYLLVTWPAPPEEATVLRTSKRIQLSLHTPQPATARPVTPRDDYNPPASKPE
jgi:hypothetical protein